MNREMKATFYQAQGEIKCQENNEILKVTQTHWISEKKIAFVVDAGSWLVRVMMVLQQQHSFHKSLQKLRKSFNTI